MSARPTKEVFGEILIVTSAVLCFCALPRDATAQDDVADVASTEIRADGDSNKRFFLIGPMRESKSPVEGYRILLVLPGGDGSAEFNPFVRRILKNGLPDSYIIAQLVAPAWSTDPNRIVWPTKTNPGNAAKFTTEEFIGSVLSEVRKTVKIDPRFVFSLGWSSGGPPCYAASLDSGLGIIGSYIAMSVFKPETLPKMERAAGHAYYILHSPQDFIPISMAERARDTLRSNGARTELKTYSGGHGWHGDVYGNIRTGIEWLEKNAGHKGDGKPAAKTLE
jgi:predicted esterase